MQGNGQEKLGQDIAQLQDIPSSTGQDRTGQDTMRQDNRSGRGRRQETEVFLMSGACTDQLAKPQMRKGSVPSRSDPNPPHSL